jgi:hypothetical protein
MEIRSLFVKVVITPVVFCLAAFSAHAAIICVGPSATGNGGGADWNNQAAWSSVALTRGNTYYLADGAYGGRTLNAAASGSTLIVIRKAIVGDAAVAGIAGWNSALGDGNATFSGSIIASSSYWVFDGMKGGGWTGGTPDETPTNYGFVWNGVSLPLRAISSGQAITDITFAHCAATAPTGDVEKSFCSTAGTERSVNNLNVRYCYAYGFNSFQWGNSPGQTMSGWITEHNVQRDLFVTSAHHGEDFHNSFGYVTEWHIRYNWVEGRRSGSIQPTMIIGALNGDAGTYYIYGNVFKDLNFADGGICAVNNGYGPHTLSGAVYNNTFVNCVSGYGGVQIIGGAGQNSMTVQNNLFVNMPVYEGTSGTFSHNAYYNVSARPSESSAQVLTTNPFLNSGLEDYDLGSPTAAGALLSSPYNVDAKGEIRGTDGTWDRGAFEYGLQNTNAQNSISPAGGLDFGPVETNKTKDLSFTVRNGGGGTLAGNASVLAPFSVVSGASYSLGAGQSQTVTIRFSPTAEGSQSRTVTFSGGGGATATVTGTGTRPDTTPPSASLTTPANGTTTSNSVSIIAAANDNVGVMGVKFFINGSEVFDDTAAPYSYSWDSSSVINGSYQVCVQARDSAGNTAWSATNTITVANPAVILPSPVAYWNFSEAGGSTATDSQANNVLTLRNGAAASVPGKFGTGLLLDGVDNRADAPSSSSLNITGNTMSVAAWVKLENVGTWQQIVGKVTGVGSFISYYFSWHIFGSQSSTTQWTPHFRLVNSTNVSVDVGSSVNVNYGEWVHLAGVYDGATLRIYVNGVEQGRVAQTGQILNYAQPLYVGSTGVPSEFANGVVDELRIYSTALSPAQARALYQLNVGSAVPAPPQGLHVVGN